MNFRQCRGNGAELIDVSSFASCRSRRDTQACRCRSRSRRQRPRIGLPTDRRAGPTICPVLRRTSPPGAACNAAEHEYAVHVASDAVASRSSSVRAPPSIEITARRASTKRVAPRSSATERDRLAVGQHERPRPTSVEHCVHAGELARRPAAGRNAQELVPLRVDQDRTRSKRFAPNLGVCTSLVGAAPASPGPIGILFMSTDPSMRATSRQGEMELRPRRTCPGKPRPARADRGDERRDLVARAGERERLSVARHARP